MINPALYPVDGDSNAMEHAVTAGWMRDQCSMETRDGGCMGTWKLHPSLTHSISLTRRRPSSSSSPLISLSNVYRWHNTSQQDRQREIFLPMPAEIGTGTSGPCSSMPCEHPRAVCIGSYRSLEAFFSPGSNGECLTERSLPLT
ncbi:unnamed protein product [Periconia digitata]|uniref:Uncharacterized protein n=1 Tax=Periconia digitata TaxID=1303443 RepID=A0A9W4UN71_9PLEO|nr:unnamed protein product [Periconia digitata]